MRRTRFTIVYVGREPALPRAFSAIWAKAGYVITRTGRATKRTLAARDKALQVFMSDGVSTEELLRLLSARSGPRGRRRTVYNAEIPASAARSKAAGAHSKTIVMSLRALRETVGRTQGDIARRVSMTQSQLSRVEARRDHLTSTVRKYVRALGGRIEVAAVLKGQRIVLEGV
jgi:hypothetical protein